MKNLKLVLFSVLTMGLALTSCSDDDSKSNDTGGNLIGKWEFTREADVIDGQETWSDYEHEPNCSKDYLEFGDATVKEVYFYGTECTEGSSEETYVKNGNTIVLDVTGDQMEVEILTLSSTTLKTKTVEVFEGEEYVYLTEFTRK